MEEVYPYSSVKILSILRDDLTYQNENIDCLFIEIDKSQNNKDQNSIVGVFYRPPNANIQKFNEIATEIQLKLRNERKIVYWLGDFNINLLGIDKHQASQEFIDTLFSFSFIPNITKPTRITSKSATLIDNIFCNNLLQNNHIFTGILYTDITDHLPIFHLDYSSNVSKEADYFMKRVYSPANKERFVNSLSSENWESVLNTENPQQAYSLFLTKYLAIYDTCFPVKTIKSGYKNKKPWLSESLKKQIKIKNKLYRLSRQNNDSNIKDLYKQFRNKLHRSIFKAEKEYYSKCLVENKNNIKKFWDILKQVINKKKSVKKTQDFLLITESLMIRNQYQMVSILFS